jgi:hypothetical protein
MFYNHPTVRKIKHHMTLKGWNQEVIFFDKVIGDIDNNGDIHGFIACIEKPKNYCTIKLRDILAHYKKHSLPNYLTQSKELAHFNNVDGIDSAIASLI